MFTETMRHEGAEQSHIIIHRNEMTGVEMAISRAQLKNKVDPEYFRLLHAFQTGVATMAEETRLRASQLIMDALNGKPKAVETIRAQALAKLSRALAS